MALIECPECKQQVSTIADYCPHCGYPINYHKMLDIIAPKKPISYENTTVRVTCWGFGGSNAIVRKLQPKLSNGWEIVSMVEDHWRGGILRHVYTVVLRRPRK